LYTPSIVGKREMAKRKTWTTGTKKNTKKNASRERKDGEMPVRAKAQGRGRKRKIRLISDAVSIGWEKE